MCVCVGVWVGGGGGRVCAHMCESVRVSVCVCDRERLREIMRERVCE